MVLDVPSGAKSSLANPQIPLFVTEGARKADAAVSHGLCCISLLGVWSWRGTNEYGGKTALPDWDSIALNERETFIVFDSDVMQKPPVYAAMSRLTSFLRQRGARVAVIYLPPSLPPSARGQKVGLDDFFAANHGTWGLRGVRVKGGKLRDIPLPTVVMEFLQAYVQRVLAKEVESSGLRRPCSGRHGAGARSARYGPP